MRSDYEPHFSWWELLELSRKLTLTGFLLLVPPSLALVRLALALVISCGHALLLAMAWDDGPPEEHWSPFDEEMLKEAIANNHMRNPAMCGPAERVFAGIAALEQSSQLLIATPAAFHVPVQIIIETGFQATNCDCQFDPLCFWSLV